MFNLQSTSLAEQHWANGFLKVSNVLVARLFEVAVCRTVLVQQTRRQTRTERRFRQIQAATKLGSITFNEYRPTCWPALFRKDPVQGRYIR